MPSKSAIGPAWGDSHEKDHQENAGATAVSVDVDALEDWGLRAAQELQEILDDAEDAGNDPGCCESIRSLLKEHSLIMQGKPQWLAQVISKTDECEGELKL